MKPATAAGYQVEQLEQVRSVCLYIATKLADLRDEWVIIGGLVPSLLIDQRRLEAADRHVGTLDLDLGLQLGILEGEGFLPSNPISQAELSRAWRRTSQRSWCRASTSPFATGAS